MKLAGIELPPMIADALRACRPHFVAAAVFSALINLLFLAPAIYMLQVYDRVVATGGKTTLFFITLALVIALLTLAALDAVRNRLLIRASARLDDLLAPKIIRRLMSNGTQPNVQAMRDFDTVRQTLGSPVIGALFDLPWAPIYILVGFMLHFWIGVLSIFAVAVLFVVAWRSQLATRRSVEIGTQAMAASHSAAQAVSVNSPAVRALGMVQPMVDRQLAQRRVGLANLAASQFSGGRFAAASRFLRLFLQSAALGLGALLAIAGEISAGGIIAASILLSRSLQPVETLIGGWSSLDSARAALRRLADALGSQADVERIYTTLPKPDGRLQIEQVGVRGPDGRPILFGVSFTAQPGELLGIIGPSGSGKTTLAKVVAGALTAEAGTVRLDGAQLSDWDQDQLGRHIGYMPQEPSLFEGTIKENISRFRGETPEGAESVDAAVVKAAQLAGVHEMILRMPNGYDTRLGPLGAGLSAGQAQRIAIARGLYGDPTVLIFDEPNAFLDADGEAALLDAVSKARARRATVIIIAHRKTILAAADKLLVLDAGRPKLFGPAREVVARLAAPAAGKETAA